MAYSRSTGLPVDGRRYSTCLVQSAHCGLSHFCGSYTRTPNLTPPYHTTRGNTLLVPFGELPVYPWVYYNYFGARGRTVITIKRLEFIGFQMIKYTSYAHTDHKVQWAHTPSFWTLALWRAAPTTPSFHLPLHQGWL